ncbi:MAG: DSD1 family PLP-dependent enzyme [Pseudomonadota bacterium]
MSALVGPSRVPPPARPGDPLDAVDTPALAVELGALERNVARMAREAAAAGVRLRPHAKTHKCSAIARLQVAAGAVGLCCQKVGEAEVLVAGGIEDVLVTNEIVRPSKLTRLATLAKHARIGLCVDAVEAATAASDAAQAAGTTLGVLVEIDVGQGRCGAAPGSEAVALAAQVSAQPGLRFDGLQAYHGAAQHFRTARERNDAIARAAELTRETADALAAAGLPCPVIGGAGTGTYPIEATTRLWTEIQPGSYVFMDADYAANETEAPYEHALFVLAGVMSRREGHGVVDAGLKALSGESGLPLLWGVEGGRLTGLSDEHATLALPAADPAADPALGETVRLIPSHCDPTVNLHDWIVAFRDGPDGPSVEHVWPVDARGAVF